MLSIPEDVLDTCSREGCTRNGVARGLCNGHYAIERRAGLENIRTSCRKTDCDGLVKKTSPHGYCRNHRPPTGNRPGGPTGPRVSTTEKMIGARHGRLVVLERMENDRHNQAVVSAACDCGGNWSGPYGRLTTGNTASCGCLRTEQLARRNTHPARKMIGGAHEPLSRGDAIRRALLENRRPPADGGCISWSGHLDEGYGDHRGVWTAARGVSPRETLDHRCRDTACVRLDHLVEVSRSENSRRRQDASARIRESGFDPGSKYWLERYRSGLDSMSVRAVDWHMASRAVRDNHYLHRVPSISWAFGLFSGPELVGICTIGTPSGRNVAVSACPEKPELVKELNRLWITDGTPVGTASWFVRRALRELPPLIVVSFADTRYGHDGGVYRAMSFHYAGWTDMDRGQCYDYVHEDGDGNITTSSAERPWNKKIARLPKVRYFTTTGGPADRRRLVRSCAWPTMSWKEDPPPVR